MSDVYSHQRLSCEEGEPHNVPGDWRCCRIDFPRWHFPTSLHAFWPDDYNCLGWRRGQQGLDRPLRRVISTDRSFLSKSSEDDEVIIRHLLIGCLACK